VVRPDDGAVDHVGRLLSTGHLGQGLKQGVERACFDPAPMRRKTLFHLPYSSGRWRHCEPVLAIHIMPSKNGRLSPAGRQLHPRSASNSGPINAHSSSESPIRSPNAASKRQP
jgi:hypothetical protein